MTRASDELLLGEWACLGLLYAEPAHAYALSLRLRPTGDVGRVWSLSRPLVYRSVEQLLARDLVREMGEEPGIAGGNRTVLTATRSGRHQLRRWVDRPVPHLRDLRSALLLKLLIAQECGLDAGPLLTAQRAVVAELGAALAIGADEPLDVVALWRHEVSEAASRFLDGVAASSQ